MGRHGKTRPAHLLTVSLQKITNLPLYCQSGASGKKQETSNTRPGENMMNAETAVFLPSALIVNVQAIDDQHADLFSNLAALKMLCIERNELPVAESDALLAALRTHCATEEKLANDAGLDFSDHSQKHKKMLTAIAKAIIEVREGRMDVFSVLRYVEYWFERHIREEDLNLGRNLQQVSSGMFDPEQAFVLARSQSNQSQPT